DFDTLVELLGKANAKEIKQVQKAAIVALQNNPNKADIVKKLSANISRSMAPSAARYFPIFAGEGSNESLQTVKNYLGTDNPLRTDAIKALASWSNPSSLDALTTLLRTAKDGKLFGIIFAGFIKQLNASTVNNDQTTLLLKAAFEFAQTDAQKNTALASLKAT